MRIASMFVVAALCGGVLCADSAFAKSSRTTLAPVASTVLDGARVRVRVDAKSHGRVDLRVVVERAATGLVLDVWFADASGAMVLAGAMTQDARTPGEYRFRVRTQKGDVLPAGAASIAELAGRAIEIRDGTGTVVATGTAPAGGRAPWSGGGAGNGGSGNSGGSSGNSGSGGGGHGRGRGGADDPANDR